MKRCCVAALVLDLVLLGALINLGLSLDGARAEQSALEETVVVARQALNAAWQGKSAGAVESLVAGIDRNSVVIVRDDSAVGVGEVEFVMKDGVVQRVKVRGE